MTGNVARVIAPGITLNPQPSTLNPKPYPLNPRSPKQGYYDQGFKKKSRNPLSFNRVANERVKETDFVSLAFCVHLFSMIRIIALCSLSALAFLSHLVHGFGVGTDPSINTNLLRYKLNDTDFKFDLSQIQVNNTPRELGGGNNNAVAFTFNRPNLAGYGVAQSRVQLLPFGFNLPHVHPRGTELLYVINGIVTQ